MKTLFLNATTNAESINKASNLLKDGAVGIFPTDTVYGIGCDALNISALKKLYEFKRRNMNKPICVLVSNTEMLSKFITNINSIERKLIEYFWPGALTIIFDKTDIFPNILTAGLPTVGIRMPNNKICLELIDALSTPIATSSANIANELPANKIDDKLKESFENKVNFIIDDGIIDSIPSTIVRVENNEIIILRKGSILKEDIEKCFGGNINVR